MYGTLRKGSPVPQASWLAGQAEYKGRASLAERLLRLGHYPGLLPANDPFQQVQGDLYQLAEGQGLLEAFDHYEGCHPEDPDPHEYCRIVCTAIDEAGERVWCWAYCYQQMADESQLIADWD